MLCPLPVRLRSVPLSCLLPGWWYNLISTTFAGPLIDYPVTSEPRWDILIGWYIMSGGSQKESGFKAGEDEALMPEGSRLISWFNWIAPEAAAGGGMWVYVHRHWTTIQQRWRQLLHFFVIIHTAQPSQCLNLHINKKTIMLHISVFVWQKSRRKK